MMSTDTIADMLIRIKNALMTGHAVVEIPHSKMKEAIAQILVDNNYVESMEVLKTEPQQTIKLGLRYVGSLPAISGVKRVSKPGRRLYSSVKQIPSTLGGYGLTIVSTNKGIMSDQDARKQNLGGEVLCQVW